MNRSLAILCFGLACIVEGVSSADVLKDLPGCTFNEVEKCGYDFVPYFTKPTLAENAKGLASLCTLAKRQIKCAEDFTGKCLDGLPKGIIGLMLKAVTNEYSMFCNTTSPKHKEYFDSIKCINKAGPDLQKCTKDMFVATYRASKAADGQKIPYSCCYYHEFIECEEGALNKACKHPAAKKFLHDILDHVFGEVLSFPCSKYTKGSEACQTLPALSTKDDAKARSKGFIEPLVVISSKLSG
ncbi:hypothetical protein HPB52_015277 [Rhipicephalus sanguineus]|uniref:Uncharacterized protein n=1 Tax=Rhipicephalus sanguineus TaxID=34632 RepID=A0A9D4QAF3_RHISA|nr:hypothetical protein HPB52_015277 [Rhipicephalus sanguineus]